MRHSFLTAESSSESALAARACCAIFSRCSAFPSNALDSAFAHSIGEWLHHLIFSFSLYSVIHNRIQPPPPGYTATWHTHQTFLMLYFFYLFIIPRDISISGTFKHNTALAMCANFFWVFSSTSRIILMDVDIPSIIFSSPVYIAFHSLSRTGER